MAKPVDTTDPKPGASPSPRSRKASKATATPPPQRRRDDKNEDSPLESLGKAVSEPVRDAADEAADEKP
ncbi:MAG: hypothetical protein ACJ8G7_04570 [Rhizobacter sp.]